MKTNLFLFFSILFVFSQTSLAAQNCTKTKNTFLLGPGDVLEVSVWDDEKLTKQVVVRPDGWFSFPLIDEIKAAGRTVPAIRKEIQKNIHKYVPDAPVTVMLMKLESYKVFVVGKVNAPGMYMMQGPTRVMQALAMAGGLNAFADKDDIQIIRKKDQKQQFLQFDYHDVAQGDELGQNVLLKPGDTIIVQ